jgi:hypothetical protein
MDRSFPLQALAFRGEEVKPPGKAEVACSAREENRKISLRSFLPFGNFIFFTASWPLELDIRSVCGISTFPLFPTGVKCLPPQSTLCFLCCQKQHSFRKQPSRLIFSIYRPNNFHHHFTVFSQIFHS